MKRLINQHPGRVLRAALGILPFALLVGFYLWGDWPDTRDFVGAALIIGGGLVVIYLENRARRRIVRPAQIDY